MYKTIRTYIFIFLFLLLALRFFLLIFDPVPTGTSPNAQGVLPIYLGWRPFIDFIYGVTYWLLLPLDTILNLLTFLHTDWFPYVASATVLTNFNGFLSSVSSYIPEAMITSYNALNLHLVAVGVLDFRAPLMVVILAMFIPVVDYIYEFIKNLIWNVLIEMSFTKRKEATYQDALEKRARELLELNVEYKNLSKETSKLKDTVITDDLTRVFNKRFFLERMALELETAKDKKESLALIMMDIDHFKRLNDTYGHIMGDVVLKAVAGVAKEATPQDCFCCRFGGEEFSIIIPAKNLQDGLAVANKIHKGVPKLSFEEHPELNVTISQGMLFVDFSNAQPKDVKEIESMENFMSRADNELYRAKMEGRNRVCYKQLG